MLNRKHLLELKLPDDGEALCSGPQFVAKRGQYLELTHFHATVRIENSKSTGMFTPGGREKRPALECELSIKDRRFETQRFVLSRDDIGKTLFCAGFPCLSVIEVDLNSGSVTMTISEIVDPLMAVKA